MPTLVHSRRPESRVWSDATDGDLLLEIAGDCERALDELINRKTQALIGHVYRMVGDVEEAKDIVQMTFFRVWENRRRFDKGYSPNTWIYRIATNLAIDHLRASGSRSKHRDPVRRHFLRIAEVRNQRSLANLNHEEVMRIFLRLSGCLTERQRAVFLLRGVEEMSSAEVAEVLGCRESTVRNHLFAARKQLRLELVRQYPEYAGSYRDELAPVEESS